MTFVVIFKYFGTQHVNTTCQILTVIINSARLTFSNKTKYKSYLLRQLTYSAHYLVCFHETGRIEGNTMAHCSSRYNIDTIEPRTTCIVSYCKENMRNLSERRSTQKDLVLRMKLHPFIIHCYYLRTRRYINVLSRSGALHLPRTLSSRHLFSHLTFFFFSFFPITRAYTFRCLHSSACGDKEIYDFAICKLPQPNNA